MKKLFTLSLFALSCVTFSQPNFIWAKPITGVTATNQPSGIAADASGNVYTVGSFTGTMDFDPGAPNYSLTSGGGGDVYVTKFSSLGNFVWAKMVGGNCTDNGNAIAVDASGNVHITGNFCGNIDLDPGPGTFTLSAMNTDCFICKLDANGNFVWGKNFPSTGMEYGNSIAVDASGNVYTTGTFMNPTDFDPGPGSFSLTGVGGTDIFVSKLNSAGNFVWAAAMGSSGNDAGYGISVDGSNNVITTGAFTGSGDFDPGVASFSLTSAGNNDIFISKLDLNGAFTWAKRLGGTVNDIGSSVKADASGNIITTGSFNGTGDFDPGPSTFNLSSAGSNDIFVSKLDASGNYSWAAQMGGSGVDGGNAVTTDAAGNIYLTGYFSNTVDFDPGPWFFNLSSSGLFDVFISKLDAAGLFSWAVKMGNTGGENSNGIALDPNISIFTTGNFQATVDFDPGAGVTNLTSAGSSDIFVHKLSSCTLTPVQPPSIIGPTVICGNTASTYSIAPVGGATGYYWYLPAGWLGSSNTNTIIATPGTSGIFSVVASNSCGVSPMQTLSITVNAVPSITITPFTGSICAGGSVILTGNGANTYTWNIGPTTTTISVSPTVTTTYSVNGTGVNGCTNTAVRMVTVYPNPTVTAVTSMSLICIGETATLTATGANNYNWNPAGTGATLAISPTVNTTYTLTGTTAAGCSNTTTVTQNVSGCVGIAEAGLKSSQFEVYPNPFYDKLILVNDQAENYSVEIYNSVGKLIFSSQISETNSEIDLGDHPRGIYFIRIYSAGSVSVKKVVKG